LAEELDVLLEPEREAQREEERLRAQQKISLLRVRVAAGALLFIAAAGVLLAFSKRETLRLAGELDSVRRAGAGSFDKLATSLACHGIAQADVAGCRAAREQDRADFNQTLTNLQKSGSSTVADHARELQSLNALYTGRLKACEDTAAAAERASLTE